jgi:hypothetical protein
VGGLKATKKRQPNQKKGSMADAMFVWLQVCATNTPFAKILYKLETGASIPMQVQHISTMETKRQPKRKTHERATPQTHNSHRNVKSKQNTL